MSIPITISDSVAATAGTIPVSTDRAIPVFSRIIVIGMTCRAIRCITREAPGYCLSVAGMAVNTAQIRPMIARIVTRQMTVSQGR